MKGIRITKRFVDNLKRDPERNTLAWDSDVLGFGVCVSKAGFKSYVFDYRANGVKRRIALGEHGRALTADQAREIARKHRLAVQNGADPLAESKEAKEAPRVRDLAARYLEEHCSKRSESTRRNSEVLFRLHILPTLGARPVASVTWADIDRIHRKLADKPVMANRLLALCSKAWSLAAQWNWFPRDAPNPGRGHDRHSERPRGRALNEAQLARVGEALADENDPFAVAAFRIALLTGARPGEVLAARWVDLDLTARLWRLPETKTGPRTVYLGGAAVEVLGELPRVGEWVFPGSGKTGHLASLRDLWERVSARADLPPDVRLYDSGRHTFATAAQELDVPADIAFKLTGHSAGGGAGHRYRHATGALLRAADLVSDWLRSALEGRAFLPSPLAAAPAATRHANASKVAHQ